MIKRTEQYSVTYKICVSHSEGSLRDRGWRDALSQLQKSKAAFFVISNS